MLRVLRGSRGRNRCAPCRALFYRPYSLCYWRAQGSAPARSAARCILIEGRADAGPRHPPMHDLLYTLMHAKGDGELFSAPVPSDCRTAYRRHRRNRCPSSFHVCHKRSLPSSWDCYWMLSAQREYLPKRRSYSFTGWNPNYGYYGRTACSIWQDDGISSFLSKKSLRELDYFSRETNSRTFIPSQKS